MRSCDQGLEETDGQNPIRSVGHEQTSWTRRHGIQRLGLAFERDIRIDADFRYPRHLHLNPQHLLKQVPRPLAGASQ